MQMDCEMNMRNYGYSAKILRNTNIKNPINEWPNESGLNYFQFSTSKIVANLFDKLLDGYNVEMSIKTIYETNSKFYC